MIKGPAQLRSLASSVISGTAASALDSGQPFFAPARSSWNLASSMPGTVGFQLERDAVDLEARRRP